MNYEIIKKGQVCPFVPTAGNYPGDADLRHLPQQPAFYTIPDVYYRRCK